LHGDILAEGWEKGNGEADWDKGSYLTLQSLFLLSVMPAVHVAVPVLMKL